MKRNTKIILGVLAVGVTATAGYFIYKRMKKKKLEKETLGGFPPSRVEEIKNNPVSVSNPPTSNEINQVVQTQPSTIAITNKTEGDKFRNWVNDNYPDYAKQIDLDRSGSYNNSYITKAWKKYGAEYTQQDASALGKVSNTINEITGGAMPSGDQPTTTTGLLTTIVSGTADALFGRTPVANPSGQFSPKVSAENLYRSMAGIGTNEGLFFNTMRPLTKAQRIQVREYYDNNGVGKKLGTLEMSVKGDFCGLFSNKKQCAEALELIELP